MEGAVVVAKPKLLSRVSLLGTVKHRHTSYISIMLLETADYNSFLQYIWIRGYHFLTLNSNATKLSSILALLGSNNAS